MSAFNMGQSSMQHSSDKTVKVIDYKSTLILAENLKYNNCFSYSNDAMLFLWILSHDNGAFEILN